jgi:hypothetical protein
VKRFKVYYLLRKFEKWRESRWYYSLSEEIQGDIIYLKNWTQKWRESKWYLKYKLKSEEVILFIKNIEKVKKIRWYYLLRKKI